MSRSHHDQWQVLPGPSVELAESPVWRESDQSLVWVDIHQGDVWRSSAERSELIAHLPERVGAVGIAEADGLVLALASSFAHLDADGSLTRIMDIEPDLATTRLNDGRVDRQGRFVCGGMDESAPQSGITAVYRLDPDGTVEQTIAGVHCANSTAFSLDGRTMYFTDMPSGVILAYKYDVDAGLPHSPHVFTDISASVGKADGSTVDAEGYVWTAIWGGSRVIRFDPRGQIDRVVELPVTNPTSVGFGGDDYSQLFVTTAQFGLSAEQLEKQPLAGRIFVLDPPCGGVPEPRFRA
jgi:L-arabinonolactonase